MLHQKHKCFYALNHSFPYSSNGYAVRSHGVAMGLLHAGIDVVVACRPGMPWEKDAAVVSGTSMACTIDGVRYLHTRTPSRMEMSWEVYADHSQVVLAEMMRVFKPSMVLAASNWQNAWPAMQAAKQLGLPFFYEVRGFWEISALSQRLDHWVAADVEDAVLAETQVACGAERVFTLNRFMRDELVRRGVSASRIDLVPNGFSGWVPPANRVPSKDNLGLIAKWTVGYVGSFGSYEGLEMLVEACASLRKQGVDVCLLLVGSGDSTGLGALGGASNCAKTHELKQLAESLGISDSVYMPGRVTPEKAATYYSQLDVVVIPRKPLPVCELVSPLKPLEAAAYGKRVLMSDVAPLLELGPLYEGFSYFTKGSVTDLTEKLGALLEGPQEPLPRSEALAQCTWANDVVPMVKAFEALPRR